MRLGSWWSTLLQGVIAGMLVIATVELLAVARADDPQTVKDADAVIRTIQDRRTVRHYRPDAVPAEHLQRILEAGRMAATAGNVQPWRFVVLQGDSAVDPFIEGMCGWWGEHMRAMDDISEEQRERNLAMLPSYRTRMGTVPAYILVFVDTTRYAEYAAWDGCLAAGNMMLTARALGYGTAFYTSFFPHEAVAPLVHAPETVRLICAMPVGLPVQWPDTPAKKSLDEVVVYGGWPETDPGRP